VDPVPAAVSYEIRTLQNTAELIESYRLRYEVYGALGYLQRFNSLQLEIDEYDEVSVPFGAFDLASGAMVGTLRLITDEVQAGYARLIRKVLSRIGDPELIRQASGRGPLPLPSIVSAEVHGQIDALNHGRRALRELSRSIVRADHRGSGVSRGLMELGMAHATLDGPVVLIGGCMSQHLPMYAKYGYQALPETGGDRFASVGQIANVLVCHTDVLPQPTRDHVDALHRAMTTHAPLHILDLGHGQRAVASFKPSRRARRRTQES
jgi:predicted GNAT family N-acyltransferase